MGFEVKKNKPREPKLPVSQLTKEQLRAIFMESDINKDGVLSKKELKQAFGRLGALIPAFRAARGLHHADANHDGVVDKDELDDLIKYAYRLGYKVA
jgi:Ca2+-binding EF-hand superfamily protein